MCIAQPSRRKKSETAPTTPKPGKQYDLRALCQPADNSNPRRTPPKRLGPGRVKNPGRALARQRSGGGGLPTAEPYRQGLQPIRTTNDKTFISLQPDDDPGAGPGRNADVPHQALKGPEMARVGEGCQVLEARSVRGQADQPERGELPRAGPGPQHQSGNQKNRDSGDAQESGRGTGDSRLRAQAQGGEHLPGDGLTKNPPEKPARTTQAKARKIRQPNQEAGLAPTLHGVPPGEHPDQCQTPHGTLPSRGNRHGEFACSTQGSCGIRR